jgi:hypothetical protein
MDHPSPSTSYAYPHSENARYTDSSEVNMPNRTTRFYALQLACVVLFSFMLAGAQTNVDGQNKKDVQNNNNKDAPNKERQNPAPGPVAGADYSGMYGFMREGEFVQVTVEDQGHVTGFVSRYGDSEGDRGAFLEQFFKSGKLDGNGLTFTTETVQGVSFEFRGTVERGDGKSRGDDAYYVLKGTLVENTIDEAKKTTSRSLEVVLKSFPQDLAPAQTEKK